jgi:cytochrome c oxidase subunit 2
LTRNLIILLLAVCATTAGTWARQLERGDVAEVKTIDIVASAFQFDPATISVTQGDTIRVRLRSADRTHAFAIKAFGVKALIPKGGDTVTVEFVASQAGTFEFICAEYCGSGHGAMKGKLVVLPRNK